VTRRADAPTSTATRPVALRMRPDLVVRPQQAGSRRYWVVKDPVSLEYFHLRDEEHAIMQMLDGQTSPAEIKRRFEQTFAPLQISPEQIQAFLGHLHRSGLLLAEAPGQGEQFLKRRRERRGRKLLQALAGILVIRFHGIDPEPMLRWLYPRFRWLFSYWFLAGCVLLVLVAAVLVAVRFDDLQARLPEFNAFFNARNAVWLAAVLALAKVTHELGHALSCKHFGGECHEMGIMLLVFVPCLYCNVSDSWMLSSKWQRIAITAAGMFVEIVLASVCTILWLFSEPGLPGMLCLNMMFVCSVSTLLFNGNPLLRYDGYFILSDLVEVPNLAQQSKALVRRRLANLFLGIEPHDDRELPETHRGLLAAYGVAATFYRLVVVVAILWFCSKALKQYRLEILAEALAVIVIGGLLMAPIMNVVRFLRNPTWKRRIKPGRAVLTCCTMAAAVVAICLIPLPHRVAAPVVLEPGDVHRVYVSVPGTLTAAVAPGSVLRQGQELGRLANLDVGLQVERLAGRRDQQRLHLKNLELRRAGDPSVGSQIPAATEALADVEQRLRELQRDQRRLILTAPVDGTVFPPPALPPRPYSPGQLQPWRGNPLDARNLGCYLKTGTLFCMVGDPSRLEAVLVIHQSDLSFVRTGQRVRITLDESPGKVLEGAITEVARTDLKVVPRELATGEDLPVYAGEDGLPRPLETSYQARVSLDDHNRHLLTGSRGRAKILVDAQPLGRRLYRFLRRTFSFAL